MSNWFDEAVSDPEEPRRHPWWDLCRLVDVKLAQWDTLLASMQETAETPRDGGVRRWRLASRHGEDDER